jgi:hypothetical protein
MVVSPFWFEKIEAVLLAAHLETAGWDRVLLSVPPNDVTNAASARGSDWARSVRAAFLSRAALLAEHAHKRHRIKLPIHDGAPVSPYERGVLRIGLRTILEDLVAADPRYRYEGIWYDTAGRIDLVAWRGEEILLVEARGATVQRGGVSASAAKRSVSEVVLRRVGWDRIGDRRGRFGILLPDDRDLGISAPGFVSTLVAEWPATARPVDDSNPIFLTSFSGRIIETSIESLRVAAP